MTNKTLWGRGKASPFLQNVMWGNGTPFAMDDKPVQLKVFSESESDAVGEAGAQKILIEGYDGNGQLLTEAVELSGTKPVTTANSFLRVTSASVLQIGKGMDNVGTIHVEIDERKYSTILANENDSYQAYVCLPGGKTFSLHSVLLGVCQKDQSEVNVSLFTKRFATQRPVKLWEVVLSSCASYTFKEPLQIINTFPGLQDIYFTVTTREQKVFENSVASVFAEYSISDI
jgi:hypothetical protein